MVLVSHGLNALFTHFSRKPSPFGQRTPIRRNHAEAWTRGYGACDCEARSAALGRLNSGWTPSQAR